VVSVIGARGGVGTSTVATNLAISVRQARQRESVALVDLDIHGGDLGLFLDLRGAQGLKHLSEDVSRLDETIIRSTMLSHASGLHLLASGYEGLEEAEPRPGSAMRVIGLLRSMHRHVVVDCGHVLEPAVKEALDSSDQVVVVTTLSLPAVRRTKRLLEALRAARFPGNKVAVVVNRYGNDQKDLLAETESMLGVQAAGLIPNDYGTANEAVNHGKPLTIMAPRTAIGQWFLQGADRLIGNRSAAVGAGSSRAQDKKGSLLGRCFASLGLETKGRASIV
jgi:pilus assembly protein CpaE